MVLTVGDIRKALAKYSDDTLVADFFGDDFCPGSTCSPVRAKGAFRVRQIGKDELFNKTWFKADLTGKKVVKIDYSPEYSHEYWADRDENASPYWKPIIDADVQERIRNWKPIEQCFHGPVFY